MNYVNYETSKGIAYLVFRGSNKVNSLCGPILEEIISNLGKAENDPDVKVIILKSHSGPFCAGSDLRFMKKLQEQSYEENLKDALVVKDLFEKIYTLKKIVIAEITGHAIGGGCGLAAVCDFSFTVPDAKFGYPEVRLGFVPAILDFFLIRKIGEARARDLLITGRTISAQEAINYNLINRIVAEDGLEDTVYNFAEKLCANGAASSMSIIKTMIAHVQSKSLEEALRYAAELNAKTRGTADCVAGIDAFLNKEHIVWNRQFELIDKLKATG